MARPKRLYKTKTGRFYYLMKGKRKYLKADAVIPKKGGIVVSTKTRKPKKKATTRKKTAFALNPQTTVIPQPQQLLNTGLPIHFGVEQKPITQVEDITKQVSKKKDIDKKKEDEIYQDIQDRLLQKKIDKMEELMKKKKEAAKEAAKEAPKPKKSILIPKKEKDTKPGSVTANSKVKHNITSLFEDFSKPFGRKDGETWRYFQKSPQYYTAIADSDELYKSRPPFVYNYVPKFNKEKARDSDNTESESGKDTKKRNVETEDIDSPFTVSSGEERDIEKRRTGKPKPKPKYTREEPRKDEGDKTDESGTEGRGPTGLYNTDIDDIVKGLKHGPCPVITSDKIGMLIDYVKPGMKKFGAIINTNPSTSDGSGNDGYRVGHWRSVFFDNDDDGRVSAEFYDPLVEGKITPQLKKVMTKIAKKMNPEDYALIKQNNLKRQMDTTNTCGYHAIKFIDDRYNDVPWSEATGYDDYMAKHKPDDGVAGEKSLVGHIKKYDKFI